MSRLKTLLPVFGLLSIVLWMALPSAQTAPLPSTGLVGNVKSPDGKPMEGVGVSAKAKGSTVTTTVYTNKDGEYYFPPLPDGPYRIWAQTVGFELIRAEQTITAGKKVQQDFSLKIFPDQVKQLSDIEWFESLPSATPEDRRMKKLILYNCSTCHNSGFVLEKRFDKAGWEIILDRMTKLVGLEDPGGSRGDLNGEKVDDEVPGGGKFATAMVDEDGEPMGPGRRGIEFYRKEIVEYLTRVRGPLSPPIKAKPLPRPTGEETSVVVTEFDLPPEGAREFGRLDPKTGHITLYNMAKDGSTKKNDNPEMTDFENRNGTDWSLEIGPHQEGHGAHDVTLDPKTGYLYFGGQGLVVDENGVVWSGAHGVTRFDTKTEKFQHFPHPEGRYNAGKEIDPKGHLWMSYFDGAWEFDPSTGKYTRHRAVSPLGRSYGLTVDGEGNAWFAQIAIDKVGYIDAETGKAGEIVLPPLDEDYITPKDRDVGPGWTATHPLYGRGPRRLGADHRGDSVWVCNFFAGRLTKIDIHTKKFVDYKLPGPYRFSFPYFPVTDKNHVVWFSLANADAEGKFDPVTEKFTFYPLPTRTHNARHSDVNLTLDVPEVWVPYTGSNKIARLQFRSNPDQH